MLRSSTTSTSTTTSTATIMHPTITKSIGSTEEEESSPSSSSSSGLIVATTGDSKQNRRNHLRLLFCNGKFVTVKGSYFIIVCCVLVVISFIQLSTIKSINNNSYISNDERSLSLSSSSSSLSWGMKHPDTVIQGICRGGKRDYVTVFDNDEENNDNTNNNNNKWVIVMTVNDGYYDFFRNWYYHYEKLHDEKIQQNVSAIVLYAEDSYSYEKLIAKFPQKSQQHNKNNQKVIVIPTHLEKVTGATAATTENQKSFSFGNWKYVTLVAKRPTRMLNVLCGGHNVLYVDADTVWKSNPFIYFQNQKQKQPQENINNNAQYNYDGHMIIDWPDTKYSHGYNLCTGFMAIKATRYGLQWISDWEKALKKKDMNQGIWNNVYSNYYKYHSVAFLDDDDDNNEKKDDSSLLLLRGSEGKSDINTNTNEKSASANVAVMKHHTQTIIQPLPSTYFPNGREYFEKFTDEQRSKVVQVHANFIIGHDKKKSKLIEYGLWHHEEQEAS